MRSITKNKYAFLNYEVADKFDVWIVLQWHEVKSIKTSNVNIKDAIIKIMDSEMRITNMDVPLYSKTSRALAPSYEPKWRRKLLIQKKMITKLAERTNKTGYVLIPLELWVSKIGFIKLTIWLAKLRKKVEKKQVIKDRDIERQTQKEIKHLGI